MEIERKWMVKGWPAGLECAAEYAMEQGYISVRPTVRIRREARADGETRLMLCFKNGAGLSRQEIETEITQELFDGLRALIGLPLIPKVRRDYPLADGLRLEVNHVDEGLPTEFWYAEVEYKSEEQARSWDPASVGLGGYLTEDVTEQPGQSMGEYWELTRLEKR